MIRTLLVASVAVVLVAVEPAAEEDSAFVEFRGLKPEIALQMAQSAMNDCHDNGYQVGVAVVDRFGTPQVFLRDRFAGAHVHETALRKAWTAASFRTDTLDLAEITAPGQPSAGIRQISKALPLGGGVPVEAAGSIIAAIGVSGAPTPEIDDSCARAGIAAVEDEISF